MTKYFENSKGKLLIDPIESKHSDLVEITLAEYETKLAVKHESMTQVTVAQQMIARKGAYSDVSTGSDALFIEYQALLAKESESAESAKEVWLSRREEIKEEFPL